MEQQVLRYREVVTVTGLERTTLWRRIRAGEFPEPIRLGGPSTRAVGWRVRDIEEWLEGRPAA